MNRKNVLGIDCCGQEIVAVSSKLKMFKNRHPSCDGTAWGWIEGCIGHICWADNKDFGSKQARELIEKWNNNANLHHTTAEGSH